jgi:coenzyme F420 hydrogenase subunit beta
MNTSLMKTDVEKVIDGGFCVGCGGCAAIDNGINMRFTDTGVYVPIISEVTNPKIDEVCPFSNKGPNENELANPSLGKSDEDKLGTYLTLKAGYDQDENSRLNSSSGGGASWILKQLFDDGHIDKVIHIKESQEQGKLFKYSVSSSIDEINQGAKTRYYPIEISEVFDFVKKNDGKYAFVGVPCFVKTVKRLALVDQDFADKLKFTISIFCGHLKSAAFGESLAWQLGVKPDNIQKIDFRHKIMTAPANNYGIEVTDRDAKVHVSPMQTLLGKDWGMGAFRLKACDFCDDIVGELADVSFGDAWLDKYKSDSKGTNLIIIRNEIIKSIFEQGSLDKSFYTEDISSSEIVKSQDASYRHRRNGVKYRVKNYEKKSKWYPVKREFADLDDPSFLDKLNWDFRASYSQKSHQTFLEAKRKESLTIYTDFVNKSTSKANILQKFIRRYKRLKKSFVS